MWLHAPFDPPLIDQINRLQAGVIPAPVHPLTCPNAKDGRHAFAGGYLGVLVALRQGLVCPSCGHRQDWLSRSTVACAERENSAAMGNPSQRMEKARQRGLDDFTRLVHEGLAQAQAMVDSLQGSAQRGTMQPEAAAVPASHSALPEALLA